MSRILGLLWIVLSLALPTLAQDYSSAKACHDRVKGLADKVERFHKDKGRIPKTLADLGDRIACPVSKTRYAYSRSKTSCTIRCQGAAHRKAGLKTGEPVAKYKKYALTVAPYYIGKQDHFGKLIAERAKAKEKVRNYVKRLDEVTAQIKVYKKKYKKKKGQAARNLKTQSKNIKLPKSLLPPKARLSKPNKKKLDEGQQRQIKAFDRDIQSLVGFSKTVESRYRQLYWLKSQVK